MAATRKKPRTVTRAFGVDLMMASHPEVRRLKRELEDFSTHGNKVWRSSMLLMDFLKKNPPKQRAKGMEIGCGWGPASIFMAKQFQCKMTAVDLDPAVFPFLHAQAELNGVTVDTLKSRFEKISGPRLSAYQYLIGSDICFWDEMIDPLFKLIRRAKKAGVKHVYIADPGRTSFLELAERCEKELGAEYDYHAISRPVRATGFILKV
ncbi:MAG TPA: methyltransferase domain-containing protein [Pseudomonadales bacterium]